MKGALLFSLAIHGFLLFAGGRSFVSKKEELLTVSLVEMGGNGRTVDRPKPGSVTARGLPLGASARSESVAPANPLAQNARAIPIETMTSWGNRAPVYPRQALLRRLEGKVALELLVNREGKVVQVKLRQSSGHRSLDENAFRAASEWLVPLDFRSHFSEEFLALQIPVEYRLASR